MEPPGRLRRLLAGSLVRTEHTLENARIPAPEKAFRNRGSLMGASAPAVAFATGAPQTLPEMFSFR